MTRARRVLLQLAGVILALGALLHLAIPVGGPRWYAFFGAPPRLVAMAEAGAWRPVLTCVAIAAFLGVLALYAFSGLGRVRRLPALRLVLGGAGLALLARGVLFLPLAAWRPDLLSALCGECGRVNLFLVATSALCLLAGAGLLAGALPPAAGSRAAR